MKILLGRQHYNEKGVENRGHMFLMSWPLSKYIQSFFPAPNLNFIYKGLPAGYDRGKKRNTRISIAAFRKVIEDKRIEY